MLIGKLSNGVLRVLTPLGPRFVRPTLSQRLYLLWTFRHFELLPLQVLNPRQRQLIDDLCADQRFVTGAEAAGIEVGKLLERAKSPAIEKRVRASTAEFRALQITQRPAFVIDTEIGDRAIFSGVVKLEPLAATIDSMLDDAAAYAAHKAHFGDPPAK